MLKIVFIGFLIFIIVRLIQSHRSKASANSSQDGATHALVKCAFCGVHFPENESVNASGRHFCCQQHRDQFRP
jgi:uncharacterized protein